ncbi:FtsZ/tubulin family protein [Pyrococcus abyssi]|uniref:Uncharacterized protein n=1 Tax=Pyrococcus abyssi (strain GE5 / Orsay) TaxID=272844 RepID=Q9UXZ6_PYRAB|nr:hypothetical protein [Pyrococcus abyssi]CAB50616.1 Hypothetical protein PAB1223 [Pyrococcus abyssi GE5]CCE71183.1 TPA: hypothetical protein PAB1223 [Pyrococcus abyssi GE5]
MRPVFIGVGNHGIRIVLSVKCGGCKRVPINPNGYIFTRDLFIKKLEELLWGLEKNSHVWIIFEEKQINTRIVEEILDRAPGDLLKFAYVLSPGKELVFEEKPSWASYFETVFYDSLWEFLKGKEKKPLWQAYNEATLSIGEMFSKLYYYLKTQMLVNVDMADFMQIVRGGNVGILRILRTVDFEWHWGIWERGLINILAGKDISLEKVMGILSRFQEILKDKDVIWGVKTDEGIRGVEVLALLVRRW